MSRTNRPASRWVFLVFLVLTLCTSLFPFFWMVTTSFKPEAEIAAVVPTILPQTWTLEHYTRLSSIFQIWGHLLNSLLYAGGITAVSLLLNALAAFAFSCLEFPGRERLSSLLLLTMFVPTQVTLVPVFLILKHLGLLNTMAGLILPGTASIVGIFLLRQFMGQLPREILEQGRIDGCSDLVLFWKIVLPLSKPSLVTLAVFTFVGAWNQFLGPLVIMLKESGYPIPVALAALQGRHESEWGLLMAGAVVTILPSLIVFLLAQRYYLQGITRGAIPCWAWLRPRPRDLGMA
jgi:multiple sugar transport system permease protein